MLGRKNYAAEEIDQAKGALDRQVSADDQLIDAISGVAEEPKVKAACESFESQFFNNLTLFLYRYLVHRLPGADFEGKDGNPLNEVRIVCDSLITNKGKLRADKQIKLAPERSVLKLKVGDSISLTETGFDRLTRAFLPELKRRFS